MANHKFPAIRPFSLLGICTAFALCFLSFWTPSQAHAATITAATCLQSDVQNAVNSAAQGDTVSIPSCAQTDWTTTLAVNQCITIQGQGQGNTILGDNVTKNGSGSTSQLITFSLSCPGASARLHDLTIVGVASDPNIYNKGHIHIGGSAQSVRIDHVTMQAPRTSFISTDYVGTGLFDHNTIAGCSSGAGSMNMKASKWGGSSYGDGSWADPTHLAGSPNAMYIENNTWQCPGTTYFAQAIDGDAGVRYVARFNSFTGASLTSHGTDTSGRERSIRFVEAYQNTFTYPAGMTVDYVSWIRGGTGIQWGNMVNMPTVSGWLNSMQKAYSCRDGTLCASNYIPWGLCNGSSPYDQNSSATGYRCADQVGAGTSFNLGGATTPPASWVGNISDPLYVFLNTANGGQFNKAQGSTNIQQDRDYYLYTAAFNGTSGVGSGPFASMPSTCTTGVAYWATDQGFWNATTPSTAAGQMYKCTSTNTWTLWYTPFTYPYPLDANGFPTTSGGVSTDTTAPTTPTGLSASAVSSSQINLSWSASTDPDNTASQISYRVFRNGTQITTTAGGVTSFNDTGLAASTNYSYTITAFDPAGNVSAQSGSASATTQAPPADTTAPSTPVGLSASAISSSQINLTWTASTDPDNTASQITYKVFRNGTQITTTAGGVTSFNDAGLAASTNYSYTVSASDPAGNVSAQSGSVSATTQGSSPPPTNTGWTWVQDDPVLFCGQMGSISSCTIGIAQIAPTQPGSVWVIDIATTNNVTITSITGGGGTWIKCPNCHASDNAGNNVDAWYNLTGNAGTVQGITINLSGLSGSAFNVDFVELLPPPGTTASLDDSGSIVNPTCTTCSGVQLNHITGTDIVIQTPGPAVASWNSVSAPFIVDENGGAFNLNTTSGAAPTNILPAPGRVALYASLAFKSSAGVFTPPSYQNQNAIVQFTTATVNCNPTCAIPIQATGAGHLLFVMAANLQNDHITSVTGGGTWVIPTGSNTCQISYVQAGSNAFSCAYVLSSSPGASTVNVTLNGSASTGFGIWEIASTNGAFNFDTQGSHVNAAGPNPPGQALTISGANDVIFQGGFAPGGGSGGSYYPQTYIPHAGMGYILFNEASEILMLDSGPTAPTPIWVDPQTTQPTAVFGIAFTAGGGITPPPPDTTAPSTPTGLSALASAPTQVNLSWTASTDPDNTASQITYKVFRNGTQITTTGGGVTSFSDTGLAASTNYSYTVSAVDPAGNTSGQSASASATTQQGAALPAITSSLSAAGTVNTVFSYQINATNNPTSYNAVGLPAGLSINTGTDFISGTPTTAGTSNVTISATNAGGTGSATLVITIASSGGGGGGGGTLVVVQTQNHQQTASASSVVPITTTGGNLLVAICAQGASITSNATITDSAGNTWTQLGGYASLNGRIGIFSAANASPVTSVTCTWSGGISATIDSVVYEISGAATVSPADTNASNPATSQTSNSQTSLTSGQLTTNNANDILIYSVKVGGLAGTWTAGAGYTMPANGLTTSMSTEYKIVAATQAATTASVSWTNLHSNDIGIIGAFIAGSGTPPPTDTTAPSTPTGLSALASAPTQVNLSWTASTDPDNTASQITYKVFRNGTQITTTGGGVTSFSDTGLAASTNYSYTVSAVDPAGNTSAQSASVSATTPAVPDTIPPTTSITSPLNGATLSGTVNVTATATDNVGVVKVEFYVDSVLQTSTTLSPYTFSFNTNLFANATHTLQTKAYDAAGNIGTSPNVTVTTNNVPQTLTAALTASTASATAPLSLSLTATAGGTALGTLNYIFYCNRQDTGTNVTSPSDLQISASTSTTYLASNVCTYQTAGTYYAKVIIQRGLAPAAQAQQVITVSASGGGGGGSSSTLQITSVTVSQITQTSAQIAVTLNQTSSIVVNYGPTTGYGSATNPSLALSTIFIPLANLSPNTTYDFNIIATPQVGTSTLTSQNYVFTTQPPAGGGGGGGGGYGGGGGGGGGGGVYVPPVVSGGGGGNGGTITPGPCTTITTTIVTATIAFPRNLAVGDTGADVLKLQTLLKSLGYFPLTFTPTTYFGSLSQHALLLYQRDHQLNRSGFLDLQSENLLNKVAAAQGGATNATSTAPCTTVTTASSTATVFLRYLGLGIRGADVILLQQFLVNDGDYAGPVTGYFGLLTQAGVKKFQVKYGIVAGGTPGTTGYGAVGPKTRRALNGRQ